MLNPMKSRARVVLLSFAALLAAGPAMAAVAHVRGTLTAVKDSAITVQTAKGDAQEIKVGPDTGLFLVTKADLSAVTVGKFVGVTSVERGGKRIAREVHIFPEAMRGRGEGDRPWDLEEGPNHMTNANIATVSAVGADHELKLTYNGGDQTIEVPDSATIVAFDKCGGDQLVAGRKVFIILKPDSADTAAGVVVGADGLKPPM